TYDYTLGLETPAGDDAIVGPGLATIAGRDPTNIGFGGIASGGGRGGTVVGRRLQADGEASLPGLIDEVKRQLTADKKRVIEERRAKHTAANQDARIQAVSEAVQAKRNGWESSPISTARVYAELWPLIMNEDWCLASP